MGSVYQGSPVINIHNIYQKSKAKTGIDTYFPWTKSSHLSHINVLFYICSKLWAIIYLSCQWYPLIFMEKCVSQGTI